MIALEIFRGAEWARVRGGDGREMRWDDDSYVSAERYAQRRCRPHLWRLVTVPDEQMSMLEAMDAAERRWRTG